MTLRRLLELPHAMPVGLSMLIGNAYRGRENGGRRKLSALLPAAHDGPAALRRYWATDVHCTQYVCGDGTAAPQYRINKEGLAVAIGAGLGPLLTCVIHDYDNRGHSSDVTLGDREASLLAIEEVAVAAGLPRPITYATRGGARALWWLAEPVAVTPENAHLVEAAMDLLRGRMASQPARMSWSESGGPDPTCKDWTRLFRLPHATREVKRPDGRKVKEVQDLPAHLDADPVLDLGPFLAAAQAEAAAMSTVRRASPRRTVSPEALAAARAAATVGGVVHEAYVERHRGQVANRHDTLHWLACQMMRDGLTAGDMASTLYACADAFVWTGRGLAGGELDGIIASAVSREPERAVDAPSSAAGDDDVTPPWERGGGTWGPADLDDPGIAEVPGERSERHDRAWQKALDAHAAANTPPALTKAQHRLLRRVGRCCLAHFTLTCTGLAEPHAPEVVLRRPVVCEVPAACPACAEHRWTRATAARTAVFRHHLGELVTVTILAPARMPEDAPGVGGAGGDDLAEIELLLARRRLFAPARNRGSVGVRGPESAAQVMVGAVLTRCPSGTPRPALVVAERPEAAAATRAAAMRAGLTIVATHPGLTPAAAAAVMAGAGKLLPRLFHVAGVGADGPGYDAARTAALLGAIAGKKLSRTLGRMPGVETLSVPELRAIELRYGEGGVAREPGDEGPEELTCRCCGAGAVDPCMVGELHVPGRKPLVIAPVEDRHGNRWRGIPSLRSASVVALVGNEDRPPSEGPAEPAVRTGDLRWTTRDVGIAYVGAGPARRAPDPDEPRRRVLSSSRGTPRTFDPPPSFYDERG